ncbi:hypothetical protein GFB56_32830 [Ensifer sp. T173]|uniref:Uncharacterized protein n=1 Tax=Ensifer canadensis TaxID=555315 RepID=A0AAW4FW95_9HYPH|nr:hypothetical protein [Ensifer canadensis]MBM3095509.1 hypothetical protein [Ensifer canadensis]UBI79106.1 hypothetical protein J3R84_23695 [Ensifer canadensis]
MHDTPGAERDAQPFNIALLRDRAGRRKAVRLSSARIWGSLKLLVFIKTALDHTTEKIQLFIPISRAKRATAFQLSSLFILLRRDGKSGGASSAIARWSLNFANNQFASGRLPRKKRCQ